MKEYTKTQDALVLMIIGALFGGGCGIALDQYMIKHNTIQVVPALTIDTYPGYHWEQIKNDLATKNYRCIKDGGKVPCDMLVQQKGVEH